MKAFNTGSEQLFELVPVTAQMISDRVMAYNCRERTTQREAAEHFRRLKQLRWMQENEIMLAIPVHFETPEV